MSGDGLPPVQTCDVADHRSLTKYRACMDKWVRWMRTDPHHALWPQIYSMLIADMTYRCIARAANADPQSALHSPIIRRAISDGYAAGQGLAIRRLVDESKGTMSLRRLVGEIRNNLANMTRENIACNLGGKFDDWSLAHGRFDQMSGIPFENRKRSDRLPLRLLTRLDTWLASPEIATVETWCNERVAHAADLAARGGEDSIIQATTVALAQRQIVRTAEAIWAYFLGGPSHIGVVPVFQYSQFFRFDMLLESKRCSAPT